MSVDWKPGDVANGHVLTERGTWEPLAATPVPYQRPDRRRDLKIVAALVAAGGVLGVLAVVVNPCSEVADAVLKVTGVDVAAITDARDFQGCAR